MMEELIPGVERAVSSVGQREMRITDDALALIASIGDLVSLNLSNTKITDKGEKR